jgi:hypothetical protein
MLATPSRDFDARQLAVSELLTYRTEGVIPRRCAVDLTAEDFFEALCQDMIGRGTNSRELVALEFDPESGEISVIGGAAVHAASYPPLKTILEMIGKACVADGIAVLGLRRITFLEEQITVEWLSRTGRWETHTYPLEQTPR